MAGSVTIPVPAGTAAGDLELAFVAAGHQNNLGGDSEINPAIPAEWTLLRRATIDLGAGAGIVLAIFRRFAAGGDPADWTFEWVDPTDSSFGGFITSYRDIDPAAPIQGDAPVVTVPLPGADPLSIDAPSLAADAAALPRMVVMHLASAEINGPWTVPAGMVQEGEARTVAATGSPLDMQVAGEQIAIGGPTGVRNAVYDNAGEADLVGMAYSVLLAPDCTPVD